MEDLNMLNSYDEAFKMYASWDDKNHSDQQLPGLKFNNKQMFWISLTHFKCYKKKQHGNIVDFSDFEIPYTGSQDDMEKVFGCKTYPGFQSVLINDSPNFEFLNIKEFTNVGLSIVKNK